MWSCEFCEFVNRDDVGVDVGDEEGMIVGRKVVRRFVNGKRGCFKRTRYVDVDWCCIGVAVGVGVVASRIPDFSCCPSLSQHLAHLLKIR